MNCTTFGEVRLYNGSVPSEGSVQVCSSDQNWSGVCDFSWDCIDATVTCKQLGYSGSGEKPAIQIQLTDVTKTFSSI